MNNFYKDNELLHRQFTHPMMREIVALRERNYTEKESANLAPSNFEEAIKHYDTTLEILGGICADVIAHNAADVDRQGASCKDGRVTYADGIQENHRILTENRLYGMSLPRCFGGLNFPCVATIMATEMIARADASMVNIWSLQDCAETINEFGDEELKAEMLPRIIRGETCSMDLTEATAGSDLQSISLRASWNEETQTWRLNGTKRFITNGDADIKLVLARSEEGTTDARGLSLFVYHKSWGGVSVRRIEHKLGIKGSPTCEVIFDNAPAKLIGNRRLGLIKYVFSLMNRARIGIGAQAVGISEAALREARKYASKRKQFGHPIIELAAVAEMISVMQTKVDASRALLYETGRFAELAKGYSEKLQNEGLSTEERNRYKWAQRNADMLTPILKLSTSEYCNQITYDAIQVFGGAGVLENIPVARLYRDARVTTIYEGTSQLQVVAAVKYISNGELLASIRERITSVSEPELAERFARLADEFEQAVTYCTERGSEFFTLHQRRLVEMGAHIVMSHLLYTERHADERAEQSFRHYLAMTEAWSAERKRFIEVFDAL
ncbi:MAG: acyl-CoA dehydrogenase [Rikenellaceae bacterium]|nr:acyl-CoA dehydrogenase [Rikenellaceae bacterium]